nr:MAG TPA: hypothetical protein [Siphoviridae sp. ctEci12]
MSGFSRLVTHAIGDSCAYVAHEVMYATHVIT